MRFLRAACLATCKECAANCGGKHADAPTTPELAALWPAPRPPDGDGPVLLLADGQVVAQPDLRDVANRLGLQTSARSDEYDVAIIERRVPALPRTVYGASEGLQTIVIEREAPGGQAGTFSRIENYLGFPTGSQGTNSPVARFNKPWLGAEILVTRSVKSIDPKASQVRYGWRRCRESQDAYSRNWCELATSRH